MRGRPRKNVVPYDKHPSVVFDYMARKTALETIAKQYNVTRYLIKEILARANVPIRTRGAPRKHPKKVKAVVETPKQYAENGPMLAFEDLTPMSQEELVAISLVSPLGEE